MTMSPEERAIQAAIEALEAAISQASVALDLSASAQEIQRRTQRLTVLKLARTNLRPLMTGNDPTSELIADIGSIGNDPTED